MLYSTYLTWWRRRWRHEVPTSELPDVSSAEPDVTLRLTLLARLASLSRMQRAVLALRYWEDLSVEDTATVLGWLDRMERSTSPYIGTQDGLFGHK